MMIMLWFVSVIFLILWLMGITGGFDLDGSVHVFLILALVALVFGFIARRKSAV